MGKNKDGIPQPSMINSEKYRNNFDEIDWSDYINCAECGQPYNKVDKLIKMRQTDSGDWICIEKCNFN